MDDITSFGEWLQQRRKALHLTQNEVAQRLSCALGTYRKWETEERRPSAELALQLARVLAVAPADEAAFVRVARAELTVDRLRAVAPAGNAVPPVAAAPATGSGLPVGIVTFLFTDIEGSTMLWEQQPNAMRHAMVRHDRLVEQIVAAHTGHVVRPRGEGDSRFAVFVRATDAIAAVVELQQALHQEPWPTLAPLRVRIAVHTGETDLRDEDYYGAAVNRCARLRGLAHGGQVLVSLATAQLVRGELAAGVALRDLGEHHLRDLEHPERVFQLLAAGLPADFPALASRVARPTNLLTQLTSFMGRVQEVAAVGAQLRDPRVRLLTLSGMGGTGKTRLALAVAADLLHDFADGAWFVDLAPVDDPGLVPSTIARALGVTEGGGGPIFTTLKAHLRDRHLLLLLDNFEQVVEAAPVVVDLLQSAPQLKVLVTSRIPLHVYGEYEFPVPPLALPDPSAPLPEIEQTPAVRLFAERARAVRPAFAVDAANAAVVLQICRKLDGLPLAIELAAARMKLFSPEALLQQLDSRLQVLTGGARDRPARQQTLRGMIDWSYTLLDEDEQRLFRRLAVFVGSWSVTGAAAICGTTEQQEGSFAADPGSMLDALAVLQDKSLIQPVEEPDDEVRFTMLLTIRDFAWEQLLASAEAEAVRDRHAAYFIDLAREGDIQLRGPGQATWLARLGRDHDNLRAALRWLDEQGQVERKHQLAGALWRFWYTRGHLSEGRRWLETARSLPDLPPAVRAMALYGAGSLAVEQGDYAGAQELIEGAVELQRMLGDASGVAYSLNRLGLMFGRQGRYAESLRMHDEGLVLFRSLNDQRGTAMSLGNLGIVALSQGDYDQARGYLEASLEWCRSRGEQGASSWWLNRLGVLACEQGDYARAARLFGESLATYRGIGDRSGCAYCLEGLAWVAVTQGHSERAARLLGAAGELRDETSGPPLPRDHARYERVLADTRRDLDEATFARAWSTGRAMTLEDAVDDALSGAIELTP